MACLSAPPVVPPALPLPFSVKPPSFSFTLDPNLCCKTPPIPAAQLNPKLPPAVIDPAIAVIKRATKLVNAYLDKLTLKCPRE